SYRYRIVKGQNRTRDAGKNILGSVPQEAIPRKKSFNEVQRFREGDSGFRGAKSDGYLGMSNSLGSTSSRGVSSRTSASTYFLPSRSTEIMCGILPLSL